MREHLSPEERTLFLLQCSEATRRRLKKAIRMLASLGLTNIVSIDELIDGAIIRDRQIRQAQYEQRHQTRALALETPRDFLPPTTRRN